MELLIGLIIGAGTVALIWLFTVIGKVQLPPETYEPPTPVKDRLDEAVARREEHLQEESKGRVGKSPSEAAKHTTERLKKYEKNN